MIMITEELQEALTDNQRERVELIHDRRLSGLSGEFLTELPRGDRIKTLRNLADLDQGTLAELAGVSRTTISDWENEKAAPRLGNARRLASIFDVDVSLFR